MTDDSDICPYISKHWATIDNWMGAPVAQTSRTHPKNFKRWEWNSRFPEATKNSSKRGSFTITALGLLLQDLLCVRFSRHIGSRNLLEKWPWGLMIDASLRLPIHQFQTEKTGDTMTHGPWLMGKKLWPTEFCWLLRSQQHANELIRPKLYISAICTQVLQFRIDVPKQDHPGELFNEHQWSRKIILLKHVFETNSISTCIRAVFLSVYS